jgi:hypothetical protein
LEKIMSKFESWPTNHGKLKIYLDPSDRIIYWRVNYNGNPESVGTENAGKECIIITGIKEIEGKQKIREFRGREEVSGISVEISALDVAYSCEIDSRGYPISMGLSNIGKDVTVIVQKAAE